MCKHGVVNFNQWLCSLVKCKTKVTFLTSPNDVTLIKWLINVSLNIINCSPDVVPAFHSQARLEGLAVKDAGARGDADAISGVVKRLAGRAAAALRADGRLDAVGEVCDVETRARAFVRADLVHLTAVTRDFCGRKEVLDDRGKSQQNQVYVGKYVRQTFLVFLPRSVLKVYFDVCGFNLEVVLSQQQMNFNNFILVYYWHKCNYMYNQALGVTKYYSVMKYVWRWLSKNTLIGKRIVGFLRNRPCSGVMLILTTLCFCCGERWLVFNPIR